MVMGLFGAAFTGSQICPHYGAAAAFHLDAGFWLLMKLSVEGCKIGVGLSVAAVTR